LVFFVVVSFYPGLVCLASDLINIFSALLLFLVNMKLKCN